MEEFEQTEKKDIPELYALHEELYQHPSVREAGLSNLQRFRWKHSD